MREPGTEEVHLNEEVQLVIDQRRKPIQRKVMNRRTLTMGFHHGILQVLTTTWKLPIITRKQLIDNWYVGNKRENIQPLELLIPLHVAHLGTTVNRNYGKLKLIHMRCVMETLERHSKKEN